MAIDAQGYLSLLQALLPPGAAWQREETAELGKVLLALADEFARVDKRCDDLVAEADPRLTYELLTDWEKVAGLPDPCTGQPDMLEDRRSALLTKLTNVGGQSRQFFIDLAASLGFAVTITEFDPFTCESPCTDPSNGEDWRFVWRVNAPETTIVESTCVSPCTEPLRDWGNELLECAISRLKPAHTNVLFGYGG